MNKTMYPLLIFTCAFCMLLSVVMIVLSACGILIDAGNMVVNIVLFSILFIVSALALGLIIAVKVSSTNKTKYKNDK